MNELGAEQARARKHLPELLDKASRGEITVITKHGKPYAALVPLDTLSRAHKPVPIASLRGSGKYCWSDQPGREIAMLRNEWD